MERRIKIFFLFNFIGFVLCQDDMDNVDNNNMNNDVMVTRQFGSDDLMVTREDILEPPSFVNWPNGTIPFYINPEHFDNEQTLIIMTSLSLIAFKTCLKFSPAMVPPKEYEHVLTFENPSGVHKCDIQLRGHSKTEPHVVILGYDCLKAPWMDRIVVRALGLPFEHNRQVRDTYIDVQYENIEQHAIPLYTKDITLPAALRALPYDINSVLHFGERDFSKNGHRTIIFKDRTTKQKWDGLTELDLRKIEIIYGPECRQRDRQEKIELCHMYPGIPSVDRKKRSIDETTKSLRVNPDITPPANNGLNISKEAQAKLINLDIEDEVSKIVEDVFRVSSKALSNTRTKFCNVTIGSLRKSQTEGKTDVLGIIEMVANYAQSMADAAAENLTSFCAQSDSVEKYQRYSCPQCGQHYYSTKNSLPYHSTKNRPYISQSTKHGGGPRKPPYYPQYQHYLRARDDNITETNGTVTEKPQRKKRQAYRITKAVSVIERGDAGGPRDGRKRHLSKWEEKHRTKYGESKRGSNSDERVKRKRIRPVTEESEEKDRDEYSSSNKRNKLKNVRKGKRYTKRPVIQDSDEKPQDSDSTDNERKPMRDEREGKKIKRPVKKDSEEKRNDNMEDESGQRTDDGEIKKKKKRPVSESEEKPLEKSVEPPVDDWNDAEGEVKKKKKRPANESEEKQLEKPVEPPVDVLIDGVEGNPKTVELSKENQEFYKQRQWPHGVVSYVIDTNSTKFDVEDLRSRLAQINGILRRRTCVRLQEIRPREVNKYEDYLVLDNSPDYVTGRVGGRQIFGVPELLVGGQHRQHTAMVVMSMLGFYFELSRHDRDEYVKVHSRHVRAEKLHHFEKITSDATMPLPYDYESATHPPWMYWRKLGKKGISTVATYKDKDPDGSIMKSLGQHKNLLSEGDITKINSVYGVQCMNKDGAKVESQINDPQTDWEH